MNDAIRPDCPRIADISALMDDALDGAARKGTIAHAAVCPLCGAALRDFTAMRQRLGALREVRCEADIAALIDDRLRPRQRGVRSAHKAVRDRLWQLAPRGLVAASVLAAGVYIGFMLAGGGAVTAMRPAALTVFDPVPPGALCVGQPWCGPGGR